MTGKQPPNQPPQPIIEYDPLGMRAPEMRIPPIEEAPNFADPGRDPHGHAARNNIKPQGHNGRRGGTMRDGKKAR